jgi:hypothetical protein
MNDEYLWQKTGEDPEIERLEKALAVFRYREALEAAPVVTAADEPSWRWRLSFAFASFAVFVIVTAVWLESARDGDENVGEVVFVQSPTEGQVFTPIVEPGPPPVQTAPERHPGNTRGKINRTSAAVYRRPAAKHAAPKDSVAALTKEERHAYEQLMLALSITGSKLKIVQDTINGTADTDSNDKR